MDTPLRQRLVGALILVALGVVFWPIIFVQPDQFPALERRPVPPSPRVDNSPLPAPDSAGLRTSPAPAIADIAENADVDMPPEAYNGTELSAANASGPSTRDQAPQVPALDSDGIPIAWSLQVATMSSRGKAKKLRDELNQHAMKAYLKPLSRNGDTWFRVYVGPKFERAQLESIKQSVDARYGVESLIARYVP